MKKLIYILSVLLFVWSFSFAAGPMQSSDAISLCGYGSLIEKTEMSENDSMDDDEVDRKRRHRRRRQVRPPKKGW